MKQVFVKSEHSKITIDTEKDTLIAQTDNTLGGNSNQKYITQQFRHDCRNKQPFYYTYNSTKATCGSILNESVLEINVISLLSILLSDSLKDAPLYKLSSDGRKMIEQVHET